MQRGYEGLRIIGLTAHGPQIQLNFSSDITREIFDG